MIESDAGTGPIVADNVTISSASLVAFAESEAQRTAGESIAQSEDVAQPAAGNNRSAAESDQITADIDQNNPVLGLDDSKFTIQISSKPDRISAISMIRYLSAEMSGPFFYYRSTKQQNDWYPVIYGVYDSFEIAERQISTLPVSVQNNKPYVRSIATVKKRALGK